MRSAHIANRLLPWNEHNDAFQLGSSLSTLAELAVDFEYSYRLTLVTEINRRQAEEECAAGIIDDTVRKETCEMLHSWELMALRNGSMVAYGFQEVLQTLNGSLKSATHLRSLCDQRLKRAGRKTFEEAFPQISPARHAAAHPGEHGATKSKIDKNSTTDEFESMGNKIKGGGGSIFVSDMVVRSGNAITYSSTLNGKFVTYELSEKTCWKFYRAANEIWSSFAAVITDFEIPFPVVGMPPQ